MLSLRVAAILTLGITCCGLAPAIAAEQVGQAVLIKTAVTGDGGPLAVRSPVHRDERIRTSNSGLGQFVFKDGTKLAVGWGSSVVIDKFVFDDTRSVKKLSIKAAKGTFRWISGNSKSSAYEIVTPAGTIGVRGTVFDFYVGGNGKTAVVLLSGSVRFCGANGCRQLKRRCDSVIATPGRGVSDPSRVDRKILNTLGNERALSFLTGAQRLSTGFGTMSSSCGLAVATLKSSDPSVKTGKKADNPGKPDTPNTPSTPNTPAPPSTPDTPSTPNTPNTPSTPDTPSTPNTPSTPSTPDTPSASDPSDRHTNTKGKGHGEHGDGKGKGHYEGGSDHSSDHDNNGKGKGKGKGQKN